MPLIMTCGVAVVVAALSEKSKIAGVPVSAAMSTANDVSAVRFGRWWWCWRRRRRSTCGPAMSTGFSKTIVLLGVLAVLCALQGTVDAVARTKPDEPRGKGNHKDAEPVIEEVNAKQLERLLNEKDFVAVYWCKCFIVLLCLFMPFSCSASSFELTWTDMSLFWDLDRTVLGRTALSLGGHDCPWSCCLLQYRSSVPARYDFAVETSKTTMVLDLRGWKGFAKSFCGVCWVFLVTFRV